MNIDLNDSLAGHIQNSVTGEITCIVCLHSWWAIFSNVAIKFEMQHGENKQVIVIISNDWNDILFSQIFCDTFILGESEFLSHQQMGLSCTSQLSTRAYQCCTYI